jgi:Fe-S cluster assembly iron-binding protein IscA
LALDEPKDTDQTQEFDAVKYVIDKELSEKIGTVNVDYVDKGWRSGFVISSENPVTFGMPSCGSGCSC